MIPSAANDSSRTHARTHTGTHTGSGPSSLGSIVAPTTTSSTAHFLCQEGQKRRLCSTLAPPLAPGPPSAQFCKRPAVSLT